jgi:hypothetical protein
VAVDFWISERLSDDKTMSYGSSSWRYPGFERARLQPCRNAEYMSPLGAEGTTSSAAEAGLCDRFGTPEEAAEKVRV